MKVQINGDEYDLVEEGSSLIDRESTALVTFASSLLGEGAEAPRRAKGMLVKFMQSGFLLIGLSGGVPFMYSAQHATHDKILGDFFVAGVLITGGSNGAWVFWSLNKKLIQLAEPYRKATKIIYADQIFSQRIKHPVVNFLSIISTLPYVYKTYLYNDIKWFALLDFFISYGYKALGYYNFWDACQTFFTISESEHVLKLSQQVIRQKIKTDLIRHVINLSPETALQILPRLLEGEEDTLHSFLHNLLTMDVESSALLPTAWLGGYPRKFFIGSSVIIPINFSVVNGAFSYYGALRLVNNRLFASIATGLAAIPTFVVDLTVTAQTFETFFDYVFNFFQGKRTSSYEVFYPNALVKFGVPFFAFGISVLAASNNIYSTRTFLNTLPEFRESNSVEMLTWFYAIANVIFSTYTLIKLAGVGLRSYAAACGTDPLRRLYAKLFEVADQVDSFLARLTPRMFSKFIHGLGSEIEEKTLRLTQKAAKQTVANPSSFFAQSERVPERSTPASHRRMDCNVM